MSEKVYRNLAEELEPDELINFIVEGFQRLSKEELSERELGSIRLTSKGVQRMLHRRFPDEVPSLAQLSLKRKSVRQSLVL